MSFYFPFGNTSALSKNSINYTLTAITASAMPKTVVAVTASFATQVINLPPSGTNGTSKTLADCTGPVSAGPTGFMGAQGSSGADITICPPGTKECPGLFVSLSVVNAARPTSSRFSIVCINTNGYVPSTVGCPENLPVDLPTYTLPTIP